MMPPGFDLVIWGHEHDCFTSLMNHQIPPMDVYQPGSSVATSLTEGEAIPKHVGIINIYADGSFKMEYVRLTTTREIIVKEEEYIMFKEADNLLSAKTDKQIITSIKEYIALMIEEANLSIKLF